MRLFLFLPLFMFSFFLFSCNNDSREGKSPLISVEKLITVAPQVMKSILDNDNIPHGEHVFGYEAYKIIYETEDDFGKKIIASGLFTVPIPPDTLNQQERELFSFPVILNEHGTIFLNREAPSYNFMPGKNSTFPLIALFTGIYGFAMAMPDYIGYGSSNDHYHPYMIEGSLVSASVDMVKASLDFAEKNGIKVKRSLYITGYSEGGYAAMAVAKYLSENTEYPLNVVAAAPLDGVYNLEKMALGVISKEKIDFPAFIGFLVYAYSKTYPQDILLREILNEPFASRLPYLYDGTKSGIEITLQLTQNTYELFSPAYIEDFVANRENPLRKKLIQNGVDNWVPVFPVKIIHCGHDNVIPFVLAQLSYSNMVSLGAQNIELVNPEVLFGADNDGWTHQECAPYAYKIAAHWFCILERSPELCGNEQ